MATLIGFLGSACGTVGGVGGGGIFVPMLTLIVGFDTKSAAAISKCKFSIKGLFGFFRFYCLQKVFFFFFHGQKSFDTKIAYLKTFNFSHSGVFLHLWVWSCMVCVFLFLVFCLMKKRFVLFFFFEWEKLVLHWYMGVLLGWFSGMIMGASASSVWYNLRVPHPTKEVPIIDYDLALLFQPMLMLGITVGVALSVFFPYWLITVLIIILFLGQSNNNQF